VVATAQKKDSGTRRFRSRFAKPIALADDSGLDGRLLAPHRDQEIAWLVRLAVTENSKGDAGM
jgi:hypothetical protein